MSQKNVVFKVFGSRERGLGHASRSMTLAGRAPSSWRRVMLINHDDAMESYLRSRQFPEPVEIIDETTLGRGELKADAVVSDQPVPDWSFFDRIDPDSNPIVAAMDHYDPDTGPANLIFNLSPRRSRKLGAMKDLTVFSGLEHAIIGDRFYAHRGENRECSERIRKVLVIFGGGGPQDKFVSTLKFLRDAIEDVEINYVIGPLNPEFDRLSEATALLSNHHVHKNPANLPELMADADVAITACGTTFFELGFLGTPAILAPQNDMEADFAIDLTEATGAPVGLTKDNFNKLTDPAERQKLSKTLINVFDGRGAERILNRLGLTPKQCDHGTGR